MRNRMAIALAIMLASLAGCISAEELRAKDEASCRSFGFQSGTPDFDACLQRETLARRYYAYPPPGWYGPGWYGIYPPPPGIAR